VEPTTASLTVILAAVVAFVVAGATGLVGNSQPLSTLQREAAPGPRASPAPRERATSSARRRPARQTPAAAVAADYAALDAHRFRAAWRTLSPAVQRGFGGFTAWSAGYATTRSSRPRALRVTRTRDRAAVVVVGMLEAADRTPCGIVRRSFTVRWRLVADGAGWTASALTAAPRGPFKTPCGSS
jgi:hypothetical protein